MSETIPKRIGASWWKPCVVALLYVEMSVTLTFILGIYEADDQSSWSQMGQHLGKDPSLSKVQMRPFVAQGILC